MTFLNTLSPLQWVLMGLVFYGMFMPVGLLFRLTRVLAELQLDIRSARVQTLGPLAVDTFYVRTADGRKLDDELLAEVELAAREMTESA